MFVDEAARARTERVIVDVKADAQKREGQDRTDLEAEAQRLMHALAQNVAS